MTLVVLAIIRAFSFWRYTRNTYRQLLRGDSLAKCSTFAGVLHVNNNALNIIELCFIRFIMNRRIKVSKNCPEYIAIFILFLRQNIL